MTTEKQIEANQLNPSETDRRGLIPGMAIQDELPVVGRLNARRHGFTGQINIMDDEDRKAFDEYVRGIVADYAPQGAIEKQLAFSIAEDYYRINRMRAVEHNLFTFGPVAHEIDVNTDDPRVEFITRQTMAFVSDPKRFGLLTLYIQRTERSIERNRAALQKLQTERQAELDIQLEMASKSQTTENTASQTLSQVADQMARTYPGESPAVSDASGHPGETPAVTNSPGHGSDFSMPFSPAQINHHRLRLQTRKTLQTVRRTQPQRENQPKGPMTLAA